MITFFVNWELWQQMTFVLAGAIVVVFIAGLVKLWWLSRFLKKHTVLDLEKRARQVEMQKSGLPAAKRMDIPFGVRAIQSGIEVDGIWISRPSTPLEVGQSSPSFASSSTLEPESRPKGKQKELAVRTVEPTPEQSPQPSPAISLSERYTPTGVEPNQARAVSWGAQSTYRPKGPSRRRTDITLDETFDVNTLDRLGHPTTRHQHVETYIPTNSFSGSESSSSSQQRTMVERSSTSSDEGVHQSNMGYVSNLRRSTLPTPQTLGSFDDPDPSTSNTDYFSNAYVEQRRNPFETPSSAESHRVSRPPLAAGRPTPHRSYSGEAHANTSSRIVNAGFEILPAGTFSRSNSQMDREDGQPRRNSHNKIQKKKP